MTELDRGWPQDQPKSRPAPADQDWLVVDKLNKSAKPPPSIPVLVAFFVFVASPLAGFITGVYTHDAHGVAMWLGGWILALAAACVAMYRKA